MALGGKKRKKTFRKKVSRKRSKSAGSFKSSVSRKSYASQSMTQLGYVHYASRTPIAQPLPNKYLTKMAISNQGVINAGTPFGTYFAWGISMNNGNAPFNTSAINSGIRIPNPFQSLGQFPRGWTSLIGGNVYNLCRIYATKIEVRVVPTSLTDPIELILCPVIDTITGAASALWFSQCDNPRAKTFMITSGDQAGGRWKKNSCSLPSLVGVTSEAFRNDLSGLFTTGNGIAPINSYSWLVALRDMAGNNIGSNVGLDFRITYYCELWDLNYETLSN